MNRIKNLKLWQKILLAIIVIGIVGAGLGGGNKEDNKSENKETVDTKKESDANKEKDKEVSAPVYYVGDLVKVGDVEYTINSILTTKEVGSEYINTTAQETFLVINLTLKNNEDEALTVSDNYFILKKGNKEYKVSSSAGIYLEDSIIYTEVNPDSTLTGSIAFDISEDTANDPSLQLQVQTGYWGTEKEIINLYR